MTIKLKLSVAMMYKILLTFTTLLCISAEPVTAMHLTQTGVTKPRPRLRMVVKPTTPVDPAFEQGIGEMLDRNAPPRDLLNLLNGTSYQVGSKGPRSEELTLMVKAMARIVNDVPDGNSWNDFLASYNDAMRHLFLTPNNGPLMEHVNILYHVFERLINIKQGAQENTNHFIGNPQGFSNVGPLKSKADYIVSRVQDAIITPQKRTEIINTFVASLPENLFDRPTIKQQLEQGILIIYDARHLTEAHLEHIGKMVWLKHVGLAHAYFRHNLFRHLGNLHLMENFALVDSQFLDLPRGTFTKWKNLTSVRLDKCALATIPNELITTPIISLSLRDNFIHRISNAWKAKLDNRSFSFQMDLTNNYLNIDPLEGDGHSNKPGSLRYDEITNTYGGQGGYWSAQPQVKKITSTLDANYTNYGISDYNANIHDVTLTLKPSYYQNNIITVDDGYFNNNAIPVNAIPPATLDFTNMRNLILAVFGSFQDHTPGTPETPRPNYMSSAFFGESSTHYFTQTFWKEFLGFVRRVYDQPSTMTESNTWDVYNSQKPELKNYLEYLFKEFQKSILAGDYDTAKVNIAGLRTVINCHGGQLSGLSSVASTVQGATSKGQNVTATDMDFISAHETNVLPTLLDAKIASQKLFHFMAVINDIDRPNHWSETHNVHNHLGYQKVWWDKIGLGSVNKATGEDPYNDSYSKIYKYYYEAQLSPKYLVSLVVNASQDYDAFMAFLHKNLRKDICLTTQAEASLQEKFIPTFWAAEKLIQAGLIHYKSGDTDETQYDNVDCLGWEPYFTANPFNLLYVISGNADDDFGIKGDATSGPLQKPASHSLARVRHINQGNYPRLTEEGAKMLLEIGAFSERGNIHLIKEKAKPITWMTDQQIDAAADTDARAVVKPDVERIMDQEVDAETQTQLNLRRSNKKDGFEQEIQDAVGEDKYEEKKKLRQQNPMASEQLITQLLYQIKEGEIIRDKVRDRVFDQLDDRIALEVTRRNLKNIKIQEKRIDRNILQAAAQRESQREAAQLVKSKQALNEFVAGISQRPIFVQTAVSPFREPTALTGSGMMGGYQAPTITTSSFGAFPQPSINPTITGGRFDPILQTPIGPRPSARIDNDGLVWYNNGTEDMVVGVLDAQGRTRSEEVRVEGNQVQYRARAGGNWEAIHYIQ